ncbi:MAG: hypothetical protein ACERKK_01130 [Poseidonibacter sp.]|uniref:hypothetical protein n=1 Tax=Poseidonibacter sp. TaxID=2321188 RepID=UPI00359D579C
MSLLQYTSNEMFSSTELIRKSKMIFDKLQKDQIEKAVILRDGKPSFMLLDFNKYEQLIAEYLELKENSLKSENKSTKDTASINNDVVKEENKTQNNSQNNSDDDYESALKKIEELEINLDTNLLDEKKEPLKEFWD